ncbi:hypothetical protein M8J76_012289 [Diaphorina citri]|nr:hypothetical protein M8J76_012289 [Diaphorina citri]
MNSLLGAFSEHIASYLVTVEDAEVILKDKPILRILAPCRQHNCFNRCSRGCTSNLRRNCLGAIGHCFSTNTGLQETLLDTQIPSRTDFIHQDVFTEGFFRIKGCDIRFIKYGSGAQVLFFTYGVLGEIRNSFKKQLTAFDPKLFTSIFWDPPGYGQSLPKGRSFVPFQYIEEDVDIAYELLKLLGVCKVSLFGWCDGGHLSFVFSMKYPHMVHKLVIWGTKSFLTIDNVRVFEGMRRLSNWSPMARSEVLKAYDNDINYITGIFNQYVDMVNLIFKSYGRNVYQELLPYVDVPVLVFHSADDVMVSTQQVQSLLNQLKFCQYYQFSSGGHSCHIKHGQVFNEISRNFILEENKT